MTTREQTDNGVIDHDTALPDVFELAQQLRVDAVRCSTAAGSGHPTCGMSAADLMAVLMARYLTYDWELPDNAGNDHLIFSKGHASPLLYAMYRAAGVLDEDVLVNTYRRGGSRLEGHPTPQLPWVDAATGSLGQGIGIGVGIALASRLRSAEQAPYRVWVLCGDSEMAEGSVWEALDAARRHELATFTVIVDVNRLGQRGPTELEWDLDAYARRVEAFGAQAIRIDGHDLAQIDGALHSAVDTVRPTVILAQTRKGRGFAEVEDSPDWHGKPLPAEMAERAIAELAMMRAVHGSTVLYPADATATVALTEAVADLPGISYLRLTRGAYPVIYGHGEDFPIGGSKVLRRTDEDDVTIFAAGVTVHEALKAHEELDTLGIRARVVDLYSIKPLDYHTVAHAAQTKAVVIAEDHHPEGGLGEAVLATLADRNNEAPVAHLAVRHMPDSRAPAEQLDAAKISARHIARVAQRLLSDLRPAGMDA